MTFHTSVLLKELLHFFQDRAIHYFVDATLGAGGHSEAFLKTHPEIKCLIGFDQDPEARAIAQKRLSTWKEKVKIVESNFVDLKSHLERLGLKQVDGIIFDLGVSSMQFDQPEKGFSFMRNGPLDMRMDPGSELTAAEVVNHWSEGELGRIFKNYGEEKYWRRAANAIVQARAQKPILDTFTLSEILSKVLPKSKKNLNPATLVFQAIRIFVNKELEVLEAVIPDAIYALVPQGRLGIISFHSLEDRIVKQAFSFAASDKMHTSGLAGLFQDKKPEVKMVTKKPLVPSPEEIQINPRSRSAKLRIIEKI